MPKYFLKTQIGKANPYGWLNKDNSQYDITRILCYEVIIDRSSIPDAGSGGTKYPKHIIVDSQNRLYVLWQDGKIMRYSSSGDDETLVGGGNGFGEAYNQFITDNVSATFLLDDNEGNFIIMDGFRALDAYGNITGGSSKVRFLKWPVGENTGYLIAEWSDDLFGNDRTQQIGDYVSFALTSTEDIYFSSNKRIFKIKNGTSTIEKVMDRSNASSFSGTGTGSNEYGLGMSAYNGKLYTSLQVNNTTNFIVINPSDDYSISYAGFGYRLGYDLRNINLIRNNFVLSGHNNATGTSAHFNQLNRSDNSLPLNGLNTLNFNSNWAGKWPSIPGGGRGPCVGNSAPRHLFS